MGTDRFEFTGCVAGAPSGADDAVAGGGRLELRFDDVGWLEKVGRAQPPLRPFDHPPTAVPRKCTAPSMAGLKKMRAKKWCLKNGA